MKELVDLPWMAPILDICRLGPSGQLSELYGFKKLYCGAKFQALGKLFDANFALVLADPGLQPPRASPRRNALRQLPLRRPWAAPGAARR